MQSSQTTGTRGKWKGKRGKGAGCPRTTERNGFNNARILPLSSSEAEKQMYEQKADEIVRRFLRSGEISESHSNMDREQRKALHDVAKRHNLITRSHGKEPYRCLVMSVRNASFTSSNLQVSEPIIPKPGVLSNVTALLAEHPITKMEREHFLAERENKLYQPKSGSLRNKSAVPPPAACPEKLKPDRDRLPARKHKQAVLEAIENSDVLIVSGGTGCGKTTQVPQFLLEDAYEKQKKVRIMVTQPRRLAAISISERVARERGENIGEAIGYQVKLESRQSDKTLLTYCTTGVLLRMLTTDPLASGITHIILDEIHERETNTDYLLITLRECLKKRLDLKVILMSATLQGNMHLFETYFVKVNVSVIHIESLTFDVKTFYLDQILAMSGYEPPETATFFAPSSFNEEEWHEELAAIREEQRMIEEGEALTKMPLLNPKIRRVSIEGTVSVSQPPVNTSAQLAYNPNQTYYAEDGSCYNPNTAVDNNGGYLSGDYITKNGTVIPEEEMNQFAAAMGGFEVRPSTIVFPPNALDILIFNGVRYKTDSNQHPDVLIEHSKDRKMMLPCNVEVNCKMPFRTETNPIQSAPAPLPPLPLTPATPSSTKSGLGRFGPSDGSFGFGEKHNFSLLLEKKFRVEMKTAIQERPIYYHPKVNDLVDKTDFAKLRFAEKYAMFYGGDYRTSIDHNLVSHVVKYLADSPVFGSVLVFLPGYDDIQEMMMKIDSWKDTLLNMQNVIVIPLHSQMNPHDHTDIFRPVPKGTRKIILSTNIAEASITIEDVIFVVDTGKAKEKAYNHEAKLSTLTVCPIAKSNAKQRAGRAGRVANGYCIRLYSENEFDEMPETQIAEMKRSAIYDVTLHAKLFAPNRMRIADFLALAPEPPSDVCIRQSIDFLEQIGAFYSPKKFAMLEEVDGVDEPVLEIVEYDDEDDEDPNLTDMGRLMSRLPLDPQLSKMLLFGLALKCLAPIVNLVAMLSNRDPFVLQGSDSRDGQNKVKHGLAKNDLSDHLMLIRLCSQFITKGNNASQRFCNENFLSLNTMKMVVGTRRQLVQELVRARLVTIPPGREVMSVLDDRFFNKNSTSWPMVQAAIAAGCYPSIGASKAESRLKKVQTFNDSPAVLHPSSILKKQVVHLNKNSSSSGPRIEFVAFQELAQAPFDMKLSIKMVTAIPSITALLFTGPIRLSEQIIEDYQIVCDADGDTPFEAPKSEFDDNIALFELDKWYGVRADKQTLRQFLRLRHKLMHFFLKGIHSPSLFGQDTPRLEMRLLSLVRELLESEHSRYRYDEVVMPNFFLKDYEYYQNPHKPYKKQATNLTDRQMKDLQKAKTLKINYVGESLKLANGKSEQQPQTQPQQNQQQHSLNSSNKFSNQAQPFDHVSQPNIQNQPTYSTVPFQNGSTNWNQSPSSQQNFSMQSSNRMQNGWHPHMQPQFMNYHGRPMPQQPYMRPPVYPSMGGFSSRGGRGGGSKCFSVGTATRAATTATSIRTATLRSTTDI